MIAGKELVELLESGAVLEGYDPALVGRISVDVRISDWVRREAWAPGWAKAFNLLSTDEDELFHESFEEVISLKPKHFIQARTLETFNMPFDVAGMFTLRSAAARRGLEQSSSLLIRPGWSGQLVMELVNELKNREMLIYPGDVIGQVTFWRV